MPRLSPQRPGGRCTTFPECVPDGIATHLTNSGKPLFLVGDTVALAAGVAATQMLDREGAPGRR